MQDCEWEGKAKYKKYKQTKQQLQSLHMMVYLVFLVLLEFGEANCDKGYIVSRDWKGEAQME